MACIDYYHLLGVDRKASIQEIKKQYRKLARQFHPDLNPNSQEVLQKFQKINEANVVLSDPERRKKYDLYGEFWKVAENLDINKNNFSEADLSATLGRRGFFRKLWRP